MKRHLFAVLAVLALALGILAATASANGTGWVLTLSPASQSVVVHDLTPVWADFEASLTQDGQLAMGEYVEAVPFEGSTCSGEPAWDSIELGADVNLYIGEDWFNTDYLGDWSYRAYAYDGETLLASSNCVSVHVVTAAAKVEAPRPDDGIFLCYSKFQTEPGVWPEAQAKTLLAQGYWYPYAVKETVAGGTLIGGYHLSCNIAATQSVGDKVMGGDGTVLGPGYKGLFGYYPVVG